MLTSAKSAKQVFSDDLFKLLGDARPDWRWLIAGPYKSGSGWHKVSSRWLGMVQRSCPGRASAYLCKYFHNHRACQLGFGTVLFNLDVCTRCTCGAAFYAVTNDCCCPQLNMQDPNSTSAWNGVVSGRKKWILYPPHITPPGEQASSDDCATHSDWFLVPCMGWWSLARCVGRRCCKCRHTASGNGAATIKPCWLCVPVQACGPVATAQMWLAPCPSWNGSCPSMSTRQACWFRLAHPCMSLKHIRGHVTGRPSRHQVPSASEPSWTHSSPSRLWRRSLWVTPLPSAS